MTRIPRTSLDVFPLNLGANPFGWTADREETFAILDAFVADGGNFLDTADSYSAWADGNSGGESESLIGDWLQERGTRAEMIIATKVGGKPSHKGLARETVLSALDASLERLQIDQIDLYYFHHDDESVAIADQVATSQEILESGKVKHVALSNYTPGRMREFFETARDTKATLPVAIQPHYNLIHRRDFEAKYRPIAREFQVAVFPYFALASGVLTGKYHSKADIEGQARQGFAEELITESSLAVVDELTRIATKRKSEPSTIALAWLLAKGVTAPIASVSEPGQLAALMAATKVELSTEEVEQLDKVSAPFA